MYKKTILSETVENKEVREDCKIEKSRKPKVSGRYTTSFPR